MIPDYLNEKIDAAVEKEKLLTRIAQLEKQLSDEQQWRVDAQLYADKLQAEVGELKSAVRAAIAAEGNTTSVTRRFIANEASYEEFEDANKSRRQAMAALAAALKD